MPAGAGRGTVIPMITSLFICSKAASAASADTCRKECCVSGHGGANANAPSHLIHGCFCASARKGVAWSSVQGPRGAMVISSPAVQDSPFSFCLCLCKPFCERGCQPSPRRATSRNVCKASARTVGFGTRMCIAHAPGHFRMLPSCSHLQALRFSSLCGVS